MQKESLTPIFIFLFFFGVSFFLIPKWQKITIINKEIKALEFSLEKVQEHKKDITRAEYNLDSYQKEIKAVDVALPERFFQPLMLSYLRKAGFDAGVLLKKANFSQKDQADDSEKSKNPPPSSLKTISFDVEMMGSYDSCQAFLKILENSSRLFNVEQFTMSKKEKEPGETEESSLLNCKVKGIAYSYQ